jgi:hypothetical protein
LILPGSCSIPMSLKSPQLLIVSGKISPILLAVPTVERRCGSLKDSNPGLEGLDDHSSKQPSFPQAPFFFPASYSSYAFRPENAHSASDFSSACGP